MNERIIFQKPEGGVGIIIPAPNADIPIEQIALKDVPAGCAFKIVDSLSIPTNRTFRDAWEADFSAPDGYGVGHEAWFATQVAAQ